MDEKLLNRVQALGVALVCISYFLPWASIMTPVGSIEVRGLYVDFAWIVLIVATIHLLLQFVRLNYATLGLPETSVRSLELAWKGAPFLLVAFFAWYAARFFFRESAPGAGTAIFGISLESMVRAGLDYGFWIGALGAAISVLSVGLLGRDFKKFASCGVVMATIAAGAAFATAKSGILGHASAPSNLTAAIGAAPSAPIVAKPPEPSLNAAPYLTITKISGVNLPKDIEAGRYSDAIIISPVFKNVGTKTIVGVRGRIAMVDGFGKEVYGFNFRDDDKLAPAEQSTGGYKFEGNQFEDDDPYHKMRPLLDGGTAKYIWIISQIAFDDGTVLPK